MIFTFGLNFFTYSKEVEVTSTGFDIGRFLELLSNDDLQGPNEYQGALLCGGKVKCVGPTTGAFYNLSCWGQCEPFV